jgi:hypothetical protein
VRRHSVRTLALTIERGGQMRRRISPKIQPVAKFNVAEMFAAGTLAIVD